MIHLVYRYCDIAESLVVSSVYHIEDCDVEALYLNFLAKKAEEQGIVINPHWANIMNHKDHHPHLSEKEYKQKVKEWKKVLNTWRINKFIEDILGGKKLEYKKITKFQVLWKEI